MYFPTIDTVLNLLVSGLFIFYMKKKLDENEEIKRSFFLNFDFFMNTLDINLQESLQFYTERLQSYKFEITQTLSHSNVIKENLKE